MKKKREKNREKLILDFKERHNLLPTERGGSVVTHETRIREVPGSNPGADQPDWFFRGFPQSSRQILGWIFITTIHLTIIYQIHLIYKNQCLSVCLCVCPV